MTNTSTTPRRRGHTVPAVLAAVAIIVALVATIGLIHTIMANTTGPVDMNGHHVHADDIPTSRASASATPSGVGRFVVPSVGLDVPLGALNVVDNTIEPPGFTSAYWVRNLGTNPTTPANGTVFIALHSLRNGGIGPGNALINVAQQKASIATGATIRVNNTTYRVTRTASIRKTSISSNTTVWANTPNRLVIITCLQRPQGGPSTNNIIIQATQT